MKKIIYIFFFIGIFPACAGASEIQWQDCSDLAFRDWFDAPPIPMLQCGHLDVPLKYASAPNSNETDFGSEVRLALTRLPAKGVSKGSIVIISGGPGISGIDSPLDTEGAANKIHESWDIIGYDPRGVKRSRPAINCAIPEVAPDSENYSQDLLNSCAKNTGIDILKHMGSDEAVNDVERIRQALGGRKLTALAYSYGTQVALLYAERFPSNVRALVLDGVVDLNEASNAFVVQINQERGYQATFERFAAWCAKERKCPLSANRTVANRQFVSLLNEMHYSPLSGPNGQQVSAQELLSLTSSLLLWKSSWPDFATVVRQLSKREINEELSDILIQQNIFSQQDDERGDNQNASDRHELNYIKDNSEDALLVINCVDFSPVGGNRGEILDFRRRIREAFPATNFLPQQPDNLDLCDLWPWKSNFLARRPVSKPTLPQLLFVAQRHDPATPWQNARNMATQFKGALITLEGDGHTLALSGNSACVDEAVVDYLNSPQKKLDDTFCHH